MFKIELYLDKGKWMGVFYFFNKEPFVIEIDYLSILRPQSVLEDMKARNPGTNVYLIETPKI
jgi:hypothetical protein